MVQKIDITMVEGLTAALSGKAPLTGTATDTGVTAAIAAAVNPINTAIAALPPVTAWVAYTPTLVGVSGTPNIKSRRVGNNLQVRGTIAVTSSSASIATMTLGYNGTNNNVTVASALATRELVGRGFREAAFLELIFSAIGGVNLFSMSTGTITPQAGTSLTTTGHTLYISVDVPIQGW